MTSKREGLATRCSPLNMTAFARSKGDASFLGCFGDGLDVGGDVHGGWLVAYELSMQD